MTIELAQSLDLVEVGKTIGSLGPRRPLDAARDAAASKRQAAQDTLGTFQDARIRELSDIVKGLGGR